MLVDGQEGERSEGAGGRGGVEGKGNNTDSRGTVQVRPSNHKSRSYKSFTKGQGRNQGIEGRNPRRGVSISVSVYSTFTIHHPLFNIDHSSPPLRLQRPVSCVPLVRHGWTKGPRNAGTVRL